MQLEYIIVKYPLVEVPVILHALPILDCSPMLFIHSDIRILRTSANKTISYNLYCMGHSQYTPDILAWVV